MNTEYPCCHWHGRTLRQSLADSVDENDQLVIVCMDCDETWNTGLVDDENEHEFSDILLAAHHFLYEKRHGALIGTQMAMFPVIEAAAQESVRVIELPKRGYHNHRAAWIGAAQQQMALPLAA